MSSNWIATTCDLTGGGTVIFDAPWPEASDQPQPEPSIYEIFQSAVGA